MYEESCAPLSQGHSDPGCLSSLCMLLLSVAAQQRLWLYVSVLTVNPLLAYQNLNTESLFTVVPLLTESF